MTTPTTPSTPNLKWDKPVSTEKHTTLTGKLKTSNGTYVIQIRYKAEESDTLNDKIKAAIQSIAPQDIQSLEGTKIKAVMNEEGAMEVPPIYLEPKSIPEKRAAIKRVCSAFKSVFEGTLPRPSATKVSFSANIKTVKPVGIYGGQNSCYLNSSLNALLAIKDFREQFKKGIKKLECEKPEDFEKRKWVDWALKELIRAIESKKEAEKINKKAQALLNTIFQTEIHGELKQNKEEKQDARKKQQDAAAAIEALLDVYNIKLTYQKELKAASVPPKTIPELLSLFQLSLRQDETNTLEALLNEQFKEIYCLDEGGDGWEYETGQRAKEWIQKYQLAQAPAVLPIHMKRFGFDQGSSKIEDPIQIPENGQIILRGAISGKPDEEHTYELSSFIVHRGPSLGGGHYVSYVKKEDGWYECNDAKVAKVEEADVPKQDAYILFFKKKNSSS